MAPLGFAAGTAYGFWNRGNVTNQFLFKGEIPSKRQEVRHILKYYGLGGTALVTMPIPCSLMLLGLTRREWQEDY